MIAIKADWLGYAAATLTTISFLPQALHTFRTRDLSGISLSMYAVLSFGIVLWLAYGILTGAMPIVLANTVSFVLVGSILVMKVRERFGAGR